MVNAVQVWSADDWESFSLGLLQARHGALNVQKVPAAHQGDWGIDYYCVSDSVIYQCYAVQEPLDIGTRAQRQKEKITDELGKLIANGAEISKLFLGTKVRYWKLLVPLHDSKEVNLHCAKKTMDIRARCYAHLDDDFDVSIQDISIFPEAVVSSTFNFASILRLNVQATEGDLEKWIERADGDLRANAYRKLKKRASGETLEEAVAGAVRAFLECNGLLDAIRSASPELHDKISSALTTRKKRLSVAGPLSGSDAGAVLNAELDRLEGVIRAAMPNLSEDNAQQIALGTASEWIMRCPLDFPPYDS